MGIEVVADDAPRCRRSSRGEQVFHEPDEVLFGAGIADRATDLAGGDIERRDQGFRAMADVFELPPFDVARLHWQTFRGPFQGLDAGHLVNRNSPAALFGQSGGRLIDRADIGALLVKVRIGFWRQPVTAEMRLDTGLF